MYRLNGRAKSTAVSVAVTATRLPASADELPDRGVIVIQNAGANPIFLGGADVTTANGLELAVGASISIDLGSVDLFGIVAAATEEARVLQISEG